MPRSLQQNRQHGPSGNNYRSSDAKPDVPRRACAHGSMRCTVVFVIQLQERAIGELRQNRRPEDYSHSQLRPSTTEAQELIAHARF